MVLRTHILSGFVLFTSLPRSFGFLSSGSFPIKTAFCFYASFLPSSFAGLLGYGYGEGSCAAYPFRYFKKKYNPAKERSTNQIMESYMKQSQVKISEVGGRLSSHGSLLLRVWLLSAFGETTCDFLKAKKLRPKNHISTSVRMGRWIFSRLQRREQRCLPALGDNSGDP